MEFITAEKTQNGVLVTYQRGDGTRFSYLTATPEKYGFPEPSPSAEDILARIKARVDGLKEELVDYESRPLPSENEEIVSLVQGKETRFNKRSVHLQIIESMKSKVLKAEQTYNQILEAFKGL